MRGQSGFHSSQVDRDVTESRAEIEHSPPYSRADHLLCHRRVESSKFPAGEKRVESGTREWHSLHALCESG